MEDTPHPAAQPAVSGPPGPPGVPEPRSALDGLGSVSASEMALIEEIAEFTADLRSRMARPVHEAFTSPADWADFIERKAHMLAGIAASPAAPTCAAEAAEEAAAEAVEARRIADRCEREAGHAGSGHAGSDHAENVAGDRRVGA